MSYIGFIYYLNTEKDHNHSVYISVCSLHPLMDITHFILKSGQSGTVFINRLLILYIVSISKIQVIHIS